MLRNLIARYVTREEELLHVIDRLQQHVLDARRTELDTLIAWRIHCEQPEVDVRADLDRAIRSAQDFLCRLEEFAG